MGSNHITIGKACIAHEEVFHVALDGDFKQLILTTLMILVLMVIRGRIIMDNAMLKAQIDVARIYLHVLFHE